VWLWDTVRSRRAAGVELGGLGSASVILTSLPSRARTHDALEMAAYDVAAEAVDDRDANQHAGH
jgi:hypothetical protein